MGRHSNYPRVRIGVDRSLALPTSGLTGENDATRRVRIAVRLFFREEISFSYLFKKPVSLLLFGLAFQK